MPISSSWNVNAGSWCCYIMSISQPISHTQPNGLIGDDDISVVLVTDRASSYSYLVMHTYLLILLSYVPLSACSI